jgi:hypothetical protein
MRPGYCADSVANLVSGRVTGHQVYYLGKGGRDALNIPVNVAIIAGILAAPAAVAGILLALFTSHRIRIEKEDGYRGTGQRDIGQGILCGGKRKGELFIRQTGLGVIQKPQGWMHFAVQNIV